MSTCGLGKRNHVKGRDDGHDGERWRNKELTLSKYMVRTCTLLAPPLTWSVLNRVPHEGTSYLILPKVPSVRTDDRQMELRRFYCLKNHNFILPHVPLCAPLTSKSPQPRIARSTSENVHYITPLYEIVLRLCVQDVVRRTGPDHHRPQRRLLYFAAPSPTCISQPTRPSQLHRLSTGLLACHDLEWLIVLLVQEPILPRENPRSSPTSTRVWRSRERSRRHSVHMAAIC